MGEKAPLRAFTALGVVADAEPYQAEPMSMGAHGIVRPWRRRVEFDAVRPIPLAEITAQLALTDDPHWGYQLRRGLVSLTAEDFQLLRNAMAQR